MSTTGLTYSEAFKITKEARDIIQPNQGFVKQLMNLTPRAKK